MKSKRTIGRKNIKKYTADNNEVGGLAMNWKFWQKDDNKKILNQINKLTEKIDTIGDKIDELSTSKKKMDRLQYKQNQDLLKKSETLLQKIDRQGIDQKLAADLKNKIDNYSLTTEKSSKKIIEFIDEFDLIRRGLEKDEENWTNLLKSWSSRMLEILEQNKIKQLNLKGQDFNPRLAEALTTVDPESAAEYSCKADTNWSNNQIVEVIKRGFKDKEDNLIRKALVVVCKEDIDINE